MENINFMQEAREQNTKNKKKFYIFINIFLQKFRTTFWTISV